MGMVPVGVRPPVLSTTPVAHGNVFGASRAGDGTQTNPSFASSVWSTGAGEGMDEATVRRELASARARVTELESLLVSSTGGW
jgi:hypothetical protein